MLVVVFMGRHEYGNQKSSIMHQCELRLNGTVVSNICEGIADIAIDKYLQNMNIASNACQIFLILLNLISNLWLIV